ncbi:hypothetical protein [Planctomyces sp. SH-PL62]|uniref:hypothetical protein n=1 Tax=Planctomyces sp. SH-PL62 TaxID=1636152 RepID=UPI00078E7481|nr:hypothetical protein [Planctomyces sp. SH-PL62]AMV39421.1 hypothetical protein VT85_18430 [Planctomyces sp. SH-PL62]
MTDLRLPRRRRLLEKPLTIATLAAFLVATGAIEVFAKLETWRQESASAFARHRREGVVISDQGRVRLGRALLPTAPLDAERVWDLARGADGSVYAATGDSGKVFRLAPKEPTAWEPILDDADGQALSLVATADGKVFVGTGPSGKVVELTDPMHPSSRPDPSVLYVWDLAADPQGNVYAATGPNGQLWKRSVQGAWSLVHDAKSAHLLCAAVGPDGSVYAGSDGEGLIYRIAPDGKASVLYDAPQSEIRALLPGPDGSLDAATAAEAGGGGSSRGSGLFSMRGSDPDGDWPGARPGATVAAVMQAPADDEAEKPAEDASGRNSAAPKPAAPGENAVYRIDQAGAAREVFRVKALLFALARIEDRLLVGTGPEGVLYEVHEGESESTPIARLDNGQILALLAEPDGGLLLGAGDPGAVVRLASNVVERGELVSDVFDAKLPSRFGSLTWQGETQEGTSIALQVRTGHVGEPDSTWSDWSPEQTDPKTAQAQVPIGRFVQYRAKLATRDPKRSPELRSVAVSYRSTNLRPEIAKLETPDVSVADGAAKQAKLNLRWDVADPNGDDLNFRVQVRKEGWPDWIGLTDAPITEKSYSWDASAFPSGRYRVRLVASDRPSNSPEDALSRERESESFLVDHEAPKIMIAPEARKAVVSLTDDLTRVVKAEYAVDGGAWSSLFPDDGLFDGTSETITLALPDLKPGVHLLMIRATDAAGNVGSGDALLTVKD